MGRGVGFSGLAAFLLGCGNGPASGVSTAIDSTSDTVVVRVQGDVPLGQVRQLAEELRIAPGPNDTSLFTNVLEFRVDRRGQLWVFDYPTSSILLFGPDGTLRRRIGRKGGGPGEFQQDNGIVALDTGIAVLDYQNARISFFSDSGDFRTSWPVTSGFFTSGGLVVDRSGTLRLRRPVTASREGEILGRMGLVMVNSGGTLSDSLAPPDLPVQREVYVATSKDGGSRSSMNSSFSPNYHWAWHPEGFFVAGNGGTYEIVLARTAGKPLVIKRELAPIPIDPAERDEEHDRIVYSMQRTDPSWSWSGPSLPETKAPLAGIRITRDGRIWAQVAAPSERIPDDQLDRPRDPQQPVRRFRSPTVYEIFEPNGRFVGRIALPLRSRLMEADGNTVWLLGRDENDLPAVLRCRIEPGLP